MCLRVGLEHVVPGDFPDQSALASKGSGDFPEYRENQLLFG